MKNFKFNSNANGRHDAISALLASGSCRGKHGNDTATTRQRHDNGLHLFRIVTLLLLLLTLGVGEMNAYTLYFYIGRQTGWRDASAVFKLNSSDADGGTTLTRVGSTDWYSCSTTATSKMYIVRCNPSGGKWNSFSFTPSSTNNVVRLTDWNAGELFSMYVTGNSWNSLGNWDNANANGKMTITATNTFSKTFTNVAASAHEFKVVEQGRWDYSVGTGGTITTKNCTQGGSGNIQFTPYIETGSTTITYNISSGEITITCPQIPITLSKNNGSANGSASVDVGASSLSSITHVTRTGYDLTGYWTNTSGGYKVINNNGAFVTYSSNVATYLNNATPATWKKTSATTLYAQWTAKNYTITLDKNGGDADGSVQTTYASTTTSSLSAPTKDGYHVTGYYSASSAGTLVMTTAGVLQSSVSGFTDSDGKWTATNSPKLYAYWEEDASNYDVTFGVGTSYTSYGSLTARNTTDGEDLTSGDDVAAGKAITFTATPNTGYEVAGFYSDASCSSSLQSGSSTTYSVASLSGDLTVYVKFQLIDYTITYLDKGGSAYSGSNGGSLPSTYNYGTGVASLTAGVKSGYTFGGWYTASDCSSGLTTSISSTATGNKTFYAKWTENLTTVTINVSPAGAGTLTVGGSAFTPGNTTTAGVTTSRTVVATAQPGYKYSSWSKTGNTAGSNSTNTYTLKGNGSGSTGTLTANFSRTYAFIEGRFHITNSSRNGTWTNTFTSGDWNETSVRIPFEYDGTNHRFVLHTYATPKELTTQISSYDPVFYIKTSTASGSLSNVTSYWSATAQTLSAAGTANKRALAHTGTLYNDRLKFNSSDESGYVVLYFDESYIWYELEQTLSYNANGGSGSAPAGTTYYLKGTTATAASNTYAKTGYSFSGWKTGPSSGTSYAAGASVTMNSNITLYAQWAAKRSALTLDPQSSAKGHGTDGTATASASATYGAAMPALSGTLPTAAAGYAFMGFYDATGGGGTKYYNADGSSAHNWDKDTESGTTLYAYYKNAEITSFTYSAGEGNAVPASTSITATAVLSPTPAATTHIDWKLRYGNDNPFASQPSFGTGTTTNSFTTPAESGTYKLEAVLRTGSTPNAGTTIDSAVYSLQVAGEHTVTIQYKCGDMTIKASAEATGRPLAWSDAIAAPSITGYTFSNWTAGDGVTISTDGSDAIDGSTTTTSTIYIKATYAGTLTANYTQKRMIYFYNTLGWENVHVYFYKNSSYWSGETPSRGSGSKTTYEFTSYPYSEGKNGKMTNIEGTNIWYFDAEAAEVNENYTDVVFTEADQDNYEYFYNTKAVKRDDYKASTMPMFVPLADQTPTTYNGTKYYFNGYWMNYPANTGYTLKIYNWYGDLDPARTYMFPYSEDMKMPLTLDVDFTSGEDIWFSVYRNDNVTFGKNYEIKQDYNEPQTITQTNDKLKVITSVPGTYKFTLGYTNVDYYIDVDYPAAVGDYRIIYKDNATWAMGAHDGAWELSSDVINKNNGESAKNDTVSFFISKGVGITATMKFQKITAIDGSSGAVTWGDVDGGSITIPDAVDEAGVYNFIVTQPAGGASISLVKAEPYTGNYYIRTDCAGNTKWNNYKTLDHQMTYSDYAAENSGFSHYFAHWVTSGTNVKFCIANDYSMCLTEHLSADYGTTIANIDGDGNLLSGNANIRFMWNQSTNKLSRAYISGSGNITDRFLVLEGDTKMYDENGNALTGEHQDADKYGTKLGTDNQVIMHDDENFVYERTIQVNATARARLSAKYNSNTQYFIGSSGDFGNSTTEEMLGGTYNADKKYSMRIVYDFKTNRLVRAYIPSGTIDTELEIHADIMLVREHQEAGQQLTFSGSGALSDVKTVYGVMRFNRYTLNNKNVTAPHGVVADPKSSYERGLYWISFPFNVNLSDVFGFGSYGTDWIVMYYDGAERASKGFWADTESFWKYITNRTGVVLEAGKGYVLALDLDRMRDNNTTFWANDIQQVELFFPSTAAVSNIKKTDTEITVPSHECTIDRRTAEEKAADDVDGEIDINKYRVTADSHWNVIGVPSYANYGTELKDGSNAAITWNKDPETDDLPFLYEWNMVDNSYTPQNVTTYPFKSMHAYMVQYTGTIKWLLASATPASPSPRRAPAQNIDLRLELQQNDQMVDQTFVRMTNDEAVSANFAFDEDMMKEFNKGKANIYTKISGMPVAGNTLPTSKQTTIVPVGVKIATNDDYTFSIPDGTSGVGVTLIDNLTGTRTNISAVDYTVSLEAGTYNERFVLEISPIEQVITNLEPSAMEQQSDVRKLLIDGLLYIVRDGKVYDARGAKVE